MEKITKKVLLEEIEEIVRINELIRFGSKRNVNEQVIPFIEKLFRGGEEGISDVVKTIERSGIKGADDVASAFRGLAEKGLKSLSQEESLFLSNVIRQVFPDMASQVSRDLSSLMTPYLGQVGVGKLEGILANERFSTEQIYRRLTTDFGMENLSILELQVWRDAIKGKPIDVRIPTTVEVKPKPENITQPTELKLTPEQTEVVEEISQKVGGSMRTPTSEILSDMPNFTSVEEAVGYLRAKLQSMGANQETANVFASKLKEIASGNSTDPNLNRALDIIEKQNEQQFIQFNRFVEYAEKQNKTTERIEKEIDDKIKDAPFSIKKTVKNWWNNKTSTDKAKQSYNLIVSGIQILLLIWVWWKDEEDKYRGPFDMSTEQTFISKIGVFLTSLITTNALFTFANTLLAYWDLKNAYDAAEPAKPLNKDDSTSDSTKVKPENSIRDIANLLSINDARQYVESAENPLNIPTEDKITYVLYDSKGSTIKDDTGNKKGVTVGVFINGEAYTQLIKDLSQKVKEKE
jgi:hypothetical protein